MPPYAPVGIHLYPWLRHLFAGGGYAGEKLKQALADLGTSTIETIKRSDAAKGFEVLPRDSRLEIIGGPARRHEYSSRRRPAPPRTEPSFESGSKEKEGAFLRPQHAIACASLAATVLG